jgi:hypothetical protein
MKTRNNRLIGLTVGSLSRSFIYEPLAVLRVILSSPAPKSQGFGMRRAFGVWILLVGWIAVQPARAGLFSPDGQIMVTDASSQTTIGFLTPDTAQDRYIIVGNSSFGDHFSFDSPSSSSISFTDTNAPPSHLS